MVYIAKRKVKGIHYFYLVETIVNENGQPRQKELAYIGNKEALAKLIEKMQEKLKGAE